MKTWSHKSFLKNNTWFSYAKDIKLKTKDEFREKKIWNIKISHHLKKPCKICVDCCQVDNNDQSQLLKHQMTTWKLLKVMASAAGTNEWWAVRKGRAPLMQAPLRTASLGRLWRGLSDQIHPMFKYLYPSMQKQPYCTESQTEPSLIFYFKSKEIFPMFVLRW